MNAALSEDRSMKMLRIAKDLALPLETVTQTIAILARKGSGKTFTVRRLAEQLFRAGQQVVDVDPKGDHWGMRSSADGKGPGLGFLILGGEHGDLPLEPGSGELVAKLIVEERVSVILDLSLFRKHEVATFATALLENLYRLKAREQYRTPVMLLVDEADAIAPQKPQRGEERMLGAIEDIVRRGRQRGIGCTLVTQRSAVLNKNVLTQAQVMIAMRTIAPQDLAAMDAWIEVHGTPEERATLMESLPSLPRGDAWVWSPGWPDDGGIFQRIHVLPIETFDSGATPKPGEKRVEPKERADVDLEALRRQMAATVERAKATDPRLLQQRVAELERELAKKPAPPAPAKVETSIIEVPVLKDGQVKRLEELVARLDKLNEAMQSAKQDVVAALLRVERAKQAPAAPGPFQRPAAPAVLRPATFTAPPAPRTRARDNATEPGDLPGPSLRALETLYRNGGAATRDQLGTLLGYASDSGSFGNIVYALTGAGLATREGAAFVLTDGGRARARQMSSAESPLTPDEVIERWRAKLPRPAMDIFDLVRERGPMTRTEMGEALDRAADSGSFGNLVYALTGAGLLERKGDRFALTEIASTGRGSV